eukprot:TRINITY_DN1048_c0_g1_i1.p1 TRINITY_DN1048_c0_g1~~TRINITY_DN1048_c0_g1_i1.p1  ORF type:complete len:197 (+),score=42.46 TRINITY_DN1048_c0_g1_i1:56-646(+)
MVDDNLLECEICMEKFDSFKRIPKSLPCGHSFCAECIPSLKQCPFGCNVPINRDTIITTNYALMSLLEALASQSMGAESKDSHSDAVVEAVAVSIAADNSSADVGGERRKSDVMQGLEDLKKQREDFKTHQAEFEQVRRDLVRERDALRQRNAELEASQVQTGILAAVGGAVLAGGLILLSSFFGGKSSGRKQDED